MLHAVIPAAGRGTRLAPLTRAVPKELLPLGSRPVLEHVLLELAAAGVDRAILVTAREKGALLDHLDGRDAPVPPVVAVRQAAPLGLGDAVLQAEGLTGEAPFVVALGDSLVGGPETVRALVAAVRERGLDGAIAVERVAREKLSSYGVVGVDGEGIVTALVEKPRPDDAPGDLAVAARYLLPPSIFAALRATEPGAGGEVQLTDALARIVADGARLAAVELPPGARRQDIGSLAGYAAAFVEHALADPELAPATRAVLDADRDR